MLREIIPGTKTNIIGAEEVWAAGGQVFIFDLVLDPTEQEYHTTSIINRVLEIGNKS